MEVSQDIKKKENQVKTAEKAISVLGKEASQMTDKVEHYVVVGSRTIPIVAFFLLLSLQKSLFAKKDARHYPDAV